MQKLGRSDYISMPWKNGGGVTTQLAIAPPAANLSGFDWRISTTEVAAPGPFSLFAGIDRSIAVLHGAGMTLVLNGRHTAILTTESRPFAFSGEDHVHALLLDGPIADFNVMTRRLRWTHTLDQMTLIGTAHIATKADLLFIYCQQGTAVHVRSSAGADDTKTMGEAVLINGDDGDVRLSASSPALLYLARLTRIGNSHAR